MVFCFGFKTDPSPSVRLTGVWFANSVQGRTVQLSSSPEYFISDQLWCWNDESVLHRFARRFHAGLPGCCTAVL